MRENEPVLLVFSVCEGEIILEKGEILFEKRQSSLTLVRFQQDMGMHDCAGWGLSTAHQLLELLTLVPVQLHTVLFHLGSFFRSCSVLLEGYPFSPLLSHEL